jgi:hypothetical protein
LWFEYGGAAFEQIKHLQGEGNAEFCQPQQEFAGGLAGVDWSFEPANHGAGVEGGFDLEHGHTGHRITFPNGVLDGAVPRYLGSSEP